MEKSFELKKSPGCQARPMQSSACISTTETCSTVCVLDIRRGSPTCDKHVARVISAANQFLVPIGFAHGICTVEPNTEVIYKVTNCYSPEHDRGVLWNDPDLGIAWPVAEAQAILSDKDRKQPRFRELQAYF